GSFATSGPRNDAARPDRADGIVMVSTASLVAGFRASLASGPNFLFRPSVERRAIGSPPSLRRKEQGMAAFATSGKFPLQPRRQHRRQVAQRAFNHRRIVGVDGLADQMQPAAKASLRGAVKERERDQTRLGHMQGDG